MFKTIKKWSAILARMPMENQVLRKDIERLTKVCKQIEGQRNMWQEMHRAAGVGYMASQDLMMAEIVRLSNLANVQPDTKLASLVHLYAETHLRPHATPPVPIEPASAAAAPPSP
jgi:hypothetical protein